VDTLGVLFKPVELYLCGGNMTQPNWNQRFELSHFRDIKKGEEECLGVPDTTPFKPIIVENCNNLQQSQLWRYDPVKNGIKLTVR
jgi:hypothetical protein